MNASYVSANTFTVGSDRTSEFVPGRRIKADCGVDGYKYGTVESSSYSSVTTVVLIESVLTSNLTTVLYGIVSSGSTGSLPVHAHDDSAGEGGTISGTGGGTSDVETLLDLTDTPAVYDSGKYLRSTASGTEWATVSGAASSLWYNGDTVPETAETVLTSTNGAYYGFGSFNMRIVINASELSDLVGSKIRLYLLGSSSGAVQINSMYVGHQASTGDAYDFDGNQVQITLGGNTSFNLPASNGLVSTDFSNFDFDGTKNLVVAWKANSTAMTRYDDPNTPLYYKSGPADESSLTDVTGYSNFDNNRTYLVGKIDIVQASLGDDGDYYLLNTTRDIYYKENSTWSIIATGALLEDGSVPLTGDWNYGPYTISGTGDIYCNDLHTSGSTIYLGSVQLSADGINLAVNTETINSLSHGAGVPEAAPSVSKYYIDTDSGGFYYHAGGAISTVLYEGSDTNKSQISASSIYTGTYPASNAFDGETNSNVWISDDSNGPNPDGSCWLQWDFGTQKRIREFRMRRRPNAGSENFPNEMEIYVSATGDFTGEETFVGSASNNDAAFNTWAGWNTISAPKAARYLRIEIHSMHRSGSGYDWVTVSEVQFMEDENLETGWNSVYESASNFTDLDDTPATYSGITTGSGIANKYLKATASGIEFEDFKVESVGSNWDDDHFVMGTYHLWIDSSGRLRVKNGAPTSDTDGTIVGTQS